MSVDSLLLRVGALVDAVDSPAARVVAVVLALVGALGILTLAAPALLGCVLRPQDLKKKYGARDDQVIMGDIMDKEALENALEGCYGLVVASSAVPVLLKRSIFKIMWKKLTRSKDIGRPQFKWSTKEGYPEKVDYEGQVLEFDAAKAAGVEKVIVVSSMGGTQVRSNEEQSDESKLLHRF